MLNQFICVGRLVKEVEITTNENGVKTGYITLAVPRSFKNANGEYDTDFITCQLWQGVLNATTEYCRKGDLIGAKGRLETITVEENGLKQTKLQVVAERITYLSSSKKSEEEV